MDFANFGKCLEVIERGPPRRGKDYAVLRVDRQAGMFDLSCFFDDFFEDRDRYHFGRPQEPRCIQSDRHADYRFEMYEFAEAFFGKFSPKQMREFLGCLMPENTENNDFLKDVADFEKRNLVAFPFPQNLRPQKCQYCFLPVNFPVKEMDRQIESTICKSSRPKVSRVNYWYCVREDVKKPRKIDFSRGIFDDWYGKTREKCLDRLRRDCLERYPMIVFASPLCGSVLSLDIWSFIKEYPIDTSHLEIVKTD
jgi:hypothetical protein